MHFQEGFAVFGLVTLAQHVSRQLALLAEQDQRLVQLVGDDRANQKAPRVHGTNVAELSLDVALDELVGHIAQPARRLEQRGDVAEDHARFGEVHYRADQGFEVEGVAVHWCGYPGKTNAQVYPLNAGLRLRLRHRPARTAGSGQGCALPCLRRAAGRSAGSG